MTRLIKINIGLLFVILLIGCKSTKTIKTDLEEEGWTVTIIDEESLDQITSYLGPAIIDSNVKTVLMGIKTLKIGFVLEFDNYRDAKKYYNKRTENDRNSIYRRGKLVIFSDSAEFLEIVD